MALLPQCQIGSLDQAIVQDFPNTPSKLFPIVVRAPKPHSLLSMVDEIRPWLDLYLARFGAVLFRGFEPQTPETFEKFAENLFGPLLDYDYGSTPRSQVVNRVYTSTEYPAHQAITLHHEMAYSDQWPLHLFFYCDLPATKGGATPIADSRQIYNALRPELRQVFEDKGLCYLRNYRPGLDVPWQKIFQTDDPAKVSAFCKLHCIEAQWITDKHLRTSQRLPATADHPKSGERVWFNQAHLFHTSNLPSTVREAMAMIYQPEDFSRNVTFGDGSPIPDELLEEVRHVLSQKSVSFPWQKGDLLLLDNMLACHGRTPFEGPRKIYVGMNTPWSHSSQ